MNQKRWTRLNSLLDEALLLPPGEQISYIKNRSNADVEVKTEAISILKSIHTSNGFWDQLIESNQYLLSKTIRDFNINSSAGSEDIPDQIGPYHLKELIASGGMGDVYLAERTDGHLQITVALKVLRKECVNQLHIRQFKAERNILARLNHPNIAHIHDGGITESGRPYLVMEYVKGKPVTEYCRELACDKKEILSLFLQICEGVNTAHSNLIVHRDLKPDNIFVTDEGTCKILDFGIAKILEPTKSNGTTGNQVINPFSIQYAAPEQLSGDPVNTATDVYALGLLLYELLAGSVPYRLHEKTPKQALNTIKSFRANGSGFNQDSGSKAIVFQKDLVCIMSKALHLTPDQRYQSAETLGSDIQKFLDKKPISEREHQPVYRISLFSKRNPSLVGTAAAAIAALLISAIFYVNTINTEKERALMSENEAAFISGFMLDLFEAADPARNISDTLTVYDLLATGRQKLENWQASDLSKADVLLSLGTAYQNIGDFEEAISLMDEAYDITRTEDSQNNYGALFNSVLKNAELHRNRRSFKTAAHHYDQALKLLDLGKPPTNNQKIQIYSGYGNTLTEIGNPELGLQYISAALTLSENLPDRSKIKQTVLMNKARAYRSLGEYAESERIYMSLFSILSSEDEGDTLRLADLHNNLGYLNKMQNQLEQSVFHYRKSLQINRAIYGKNHPTSLIVLNNLAAAYNELELFDEVENILFELLELNTQTYGPSHWRTATAHQALGIFHVQWDNLQESAAYFEKAAQLYQETLGEDHIWTARAKLYHAFSLLPNGSEPGVKTQFQEAHQLLLDKRASFSHYDVVMINNLIQNLEEYPELSGTREFALLKSLR